jgi:nitrate/nitrite transporter NarK
MFFALQLDRGNISQALSDNMLTDIGISTNDYNTGQTIFYLCFLFAELPSQMIGKKFGPDNWVPVQMVLWSVVAACQAFIHNRSSFWACRALLGLIEGGFVSSLLTAKMCRCLSDLVIDSRQHLVLELLVHLARASH